MVPWMDVTPSQTNSLDFYGKNTYEEQIQYMMEKGKALTECYFLLCPTGQIKKLDGSMVFLGKGQE